MKRMKRKKYVHKSVMKFAYDARRICRDQSLPRKIDNAENLYKSFYNDYISISFISFSY